MHRVLRRVVLVCVVAAVAGAIALAFRTRPVLVDTIVVTRGPLQVTVDEDGRTRIREPYVVSAPLTGRLQRISLDPGDSVARDETVVATIEPVDPSLLDERTVAESRARVSAAEAAVKRAESLVERSKVSLDRAESELGRIRRLAEANAASPDDMESAELTFQAAGKDYQAAVFSREIAEFERELARAASVRSGQNSDADTVAEYLVIRAPISGEVLRVFEENSRVVSPGTPLLEIGDSTDLELEIDVLSTDAVRIRSGQKVQIDHWGGDHTLNGTVRLIEPSAFTKVSALGVEEQRVNVIVDLTDSRKQRTGLRDAFRVEAHIVTWSSDDVLKIPSSALFRSADQWSVFVVHEGVANVVGVEPGHRNSLEVEIVGGLSAGDEIVLYPGDRVRQGTTIERRQ
ncbi:MAG: HlyD family efflux transporter periplasmic adaptor subunit [Rhodopirellula sp.]|nr:HlyD family efflux transporter periplasmic adaptor subunit [Rhodopirellula sp.]